MRILRYAALLAGLIVPMGSLAAQGTSDDGETQVLLRVVQPMAVTKVADLRFGDVFRGQAPKSINPRLEQQLDLPGDDGGRAHFTVVSSRNLDVQLTFTLVNPVRVSGTEEIEVTTPRYCLVEAAGACASDEALINGTPFTAPAFVGGANDDAVTRHIYLGGTVEAAVGQALGNYLGTLTVRAEYINL